MEILIDDLDKTNFQSNSIELFYKKIKQVGKGAFGTVYKAFELSTGRTVAIKKISINKMKDKNEVLKEIDLLKQVNHPNIVKYYNYYKDENYIYIIMEYLEGGTLKNYIISQKNQINENNARIIIKQLLQALSYLHYTCDICHRDIKPENVMLIEKDNISLIKLVDFGLSSNSFESHNILDNCGTLIYMAPEQISKKIYSKGVDIWSVGIILYMLLNKGNHPFYNKDDNWKQIVNKINNTEIEFKLNEYPISLIGRHFIYKLLEKNPLYRYTAKPALEHPWISMKKYDKIPMTIYDKLIFDEYVQKMFIFIMTSCFMLKYKMKFLKEKIKNNILNKSTFIKQNKIKNNNNNILDNNNNSFININHINEENNLEDYEKNIKKINEIYQQKYKELRENIFLPNFNTNHSHLFINKNFIKKKINNSNNKNIEINNIFKENLSKENIKNEEKIFPLLSETPISPPIRYVKTNKHINDKSPLKTKKLLSKINILNKNEFTPDILLLNPKQKIKNQLNNYKFFLDTNLEKNDNEKIIRIKKKCILNKIDNSSIIDRKNKILLRKKNIIDCSLPEIEKKSLIEFKNENIKKKFIGLHISSSVKKINKYQINNLQIKKLFHNNIKLPPI